MNRKEFVELIKSSLNQPYIDSFINFGRFKVTLYAGETLDVMTHKPLQDLLSNLWNKQECIELIQSCIEIDWTTTEDLEDEETYAHSLYLNPHELYDIMFPPSDNMVTLYRISEPSGSDLSVGPLLSPSENLKFNGDPRSEKSFEGIFSHLITRSNKEEKYIRNWAFAVADIEHFVDWIDEESLGRLERTGFFLTEIEVPSNRVIHGKSQSIFHSGHSKVIREIPINHLPHRKSNESKPKPKVKI